MNDKTTAIVFDFASIAKAMRGVSEEAATDDGYCAHCEGGGWECYGLGRGDPHFRECPQCHNPKGHPSP